jgi:cytochrome c oxidase cbb3-type subunit 3
MLERADILAVIDHVRQLSGLDAQKKPGPGAAVFKDNCTDCHGAEGKGNKEMGAPNLTDNIWLYGSSRETIFNTLFQGRTGYMPQWRDRMSPEQIKILTVYVASLNRP